MALVRARKTPVFITTAFSGKSMALPEIFSEEDPWPGESGAGEAMAALWGVGCAMGRAWVLMSLSRFLAVPYGATEMAVFCRSQWLTPADLRPFPAATQLSFLSPPRKFSQSFFHERYVSHGSSVCSKRSPEAPCESDRALSFALNVGVATLGW